MNKKVIINKKIVIYIFLLLGLNNIFSQTPDIYYSYMKDDDYQSIGNLIRSEIKMEQDSFYFPMYKSFTECDNFMFTEYLVKKDLLPTNCLLNNKKTPIETAFICQNYDFVKYVLNNKGLGPFPICLESKDTNFLNYIIAHSEVNKRDDRGKTILHYAAEYLSDTSMIRILLEKGANLSIKGYADEYPIESAILNENEDVFWLMFNKHNSKKIEKDTRVLINSATMVGNIKIIEALLKEYPIELLNTVDRDSDFILDHAITYSMNLFPQAYFDYESEIGINQKSLQIFEFLCNKGLNISHFIEQKPNIFLKLRPYPDIIQYFLNKDTNTCINQKNQILLSKLMVEPIIDIFKIESLSGSIDTNKLVKNNRIQKYLEILNTLYNCSKLSSTSNNEVLWEPLFSECLKNGFKYFVNYVITKYQLPLEISPQKN